MAYHDEFRKLKAAVFLFSFCTPGKAGYLWPTNACLQVKKRKQIHSESRTYLVVHKTECREECQGRSK